MSGLEPDETPLGSFGALRGAWPGVLTLQSFAVMMPLVIWLPVVATAAIAAGFSVMVTTFVTRRRPAFTVMVTDRAVLVIDHPRRGRPDAEATATRWPPSSIRWKGPNRQAYFEVGTAQLWVPSGQRAEAHRLAAL